MALNLDSVELLDPYGQTLPITITANTLPIMSGFVVEGQVELQGRGQSSGVMVTAADQQVQTDSTGRFEIGVAGTYLLTLTNPGYLSARAEGSLSATDLPGPRTFSLGRITLPAGEVTGDDEINILDLAFIASRYGQQQLTADLNGDGTVSIFDLVLAAANYNRRGPIIVQP